MAERGILEQIKTGLGINFDNVGFDSELLLFLNSIAAAAIQLGVDELIPVLPIDSDTTYPTFGSEMLKSLVSHYFMARTRITFDPTASETIANALSSIITELEGRINYEVQDILNP